MKMERETEVVIAFLRAAIEQKPFQIGEQEIDWEKVGKIWKFHKVVNMAYYGYLQAEDKERVPEELAEKLKKANEMAKMKEAYQHFGLEEICSKFEQKGIDFLPLKGCILKYFYPVPEMRLMSDLDILYKIENKEEMQQCFDEMGYQLKKDGDVHVEYKKPPFLHIEMHKQLIRGQEDQKKYFDEIWSRVHLAEGKHHEYEMTWEDYYLFLLAHMAKHFSFCGTGIRSLLDFHVFYQKKAAELDRTILDKRLKEIKLDQFESFLLDLDACVFGESEWSDEQLWQTFDYMLMSGTYGNLKHYYVNTVSGEKGAETNLVLGKMHYLMRMIFPERVKMEKLYPWLKGRRYLLGAAWIHRIFHRMLFKREKSLEVLSHAKIADEELDRMQQIHKRAGLRG